MISAYVLNVLHSPRTSKDQRDLYYLNFSLDTKSRLSQIKDQRRYGQWLMIDLDGIHYVKVALSLQKSALTSDLITEYIHHSVIILLSF